METTDLLRLLKLMILEGIQYDEFEEVSYFEDKIDIWLELNLLAKPINYTDYKIFIDSL